MGKDLIWESNDVKLFENNIDIDLKFDKHVLKLSSKANQKLSTLSRMVKLLSFNNRRTLCKNCLKASLFGCLIVDVPTTKLIGYICKKRKIINLWSKPELVILSLNSVLKVKTT